VGIWQSKVQQPKRSKKRAIAIDLGPAEIWLGQWLVNGARRCRFKALNLVSAHCNGLAAKPQAPANRHPSGVAGLRAESAVEGAAKVGYGAFPFKPFKDFIILTDFSRCQGNAIGRVSRRPNSRCPQQPYGFEYKDSP
jgi:hypothetical protein